MNILVIDAQGGGIGRQVITALKKRFEDLHIIAVGTNSIATQAMLKAGADEAATGENPVVVCARSVDVIIGPIGIVVADSMLGEVTETMAAAIGRSKAKRILIPVNHCDNYVVGVPDLSMNRLIEGVVSEVASIVES